MVQTETISFIVKGCWSPDSHSKCTFPQITLYEEAGTALSTPLALPNWQFPLLFAISLTESQSY